jgi:hypothetical protein
MSTTPEERAVLDSLIAQMREIAAKVKADRIDNPIADDMRQLQAMAPELVPDSIINASAWLYHRDEMTAYDKLVARHNVIVSQINARTKAKRDAAAAAKERAKVRASMCDTCFTIHPEGECY